MFEQRWGAARDNPVPAAWATLRPARTVLAVVHNVTSATRLLDVLPVLAGDPRIQVVFTCPESSAFTPGTADFLAAQGVARMDWAQAVDTGFDLAISSSYGGPLERLAAPLLVVPHGVGYNKYLSEIGNRKSEIGNRKSVFGLSSDWLIRDGRLVPAAIVLSHFEQLERLRRACPEAVPIAVVAGDPCYDRMLASAPLRDTYRAALGGDGRQLVFVSSTWGTRSLFGTRPELVRDIRAALPLDEYAVALALHPNTWFGHSPWQVRQWLDEWARAGVIVVPPEEGWRAALVASDVVIGDHGSVTYYGAALGRPTLLAVRPKDTVDPASAIGRFLATAPPLTREPLPDQLARARGCIPTYVSSAPGRCHELVRAQCYRMLDLSIPDCDVSARVLPVPDVERRPVSATAVTVAGDTLTRYAAPIPNAHLVVSTDEPRRAVLEAADIVVHDAPGPRSWPTTVLRSLPGALLATMPCGTDEWWVGMRDGTVLAFTCDSVDGRVWASLVHAWLYAETDIANPPPTATVTVAGEKHHATIRRVR